MKKFTLVGLIVAAICFALGIILVIVGVNRDGDFKNFWNNGFDVISEEHSGRDFDLNYDESDFTELASGDGSSIDNLDININAGGLVIKPSEGNTYRVLTSNTSKSSANMDGNTLSVQETGSRKHFWLTIGHWSTRYTKIIIYIPEKTLQNMDISISAGTVKLYNCNADKFSIDMDAGAFFGVDTQNFKEFTADLDAGDMEFDELNAGHADISTDVGNFSMSGGVLDDGTIDCSMGNIDATLNGKEEDYGFDIDVNMGNVDIGDESYSGMSKDYQVNGGKKIDISCDMGNVSVDFKDK